MSDSKTDAITTATEAKTIVRRYIEDVWGKGDCVAEGELIAADFVDHNPPPGFTSDCEGHRRFLGMFRTAFPDARIVLEDLIAEGDKVVDRRTMRARHRGEFFGIPPTDRRFSITGMDFSRIAEGKIVEIWHQEVVLGMMCQLGVKPPSEQTGS